MSKRLLCIDTTSNCLDICMRAQQSGWDVRWWDMTRDSGEPRRAGNGIVPKITDFNELKRKWLDWADLVYVPDNCKYLDFLEPYRLRGYPIFGPSAEAANLELNRGEGQRAMKAAGLQIMESKVFHDYDEAAAFLKKNRNFLVSKPSGEADKALSYVADEVDDMLFMLGRWKKVEKYRKAAAKDGFIMQEKKSGCEMAVGGWFGPGGWSKWFYENYEQKKLFAGDQGPNTGEMGTLSQMVRKSKLADQVLLPMTPLLEKLGYVGFIDNNCMIDDKGIPWPMEFTMRDGWPTRYNVEAHVKNKDRTQWMLDLVNGDDTIEAVDNEVCVSVVMCIPDFPYSKLTNKEVSGIPLYGKIDPERCHLVEMELGEAPVTIGDKDVVLPVPVTTGDYVMVATGTGESITQARRMAYNARNQIRMPASPFSRIDIGRGRMVKQLPILRALGYSMKLDY